MKLSLLALCLLISLISYAQKDNADKLFDKGLSKYGQESGVIKYEITGDAEGSATRTFIMQGWRETFTQELVINKFGTTKKENKTELGAGDYRYSINHQSNLARELKKSQLSGLLGYKSNEESWKIILEADGAELSGTAELLGKTVNIWKFTKGTTIEIQEWRGIPLKITKKLPGVKYDIVATSFEPVSDLDASSFVFPSNVTLN